MGQTERSSGERQARGRRRRSSRASWTLALEQIKPQLAKLSAAAPGGDDWVHEIKFDGYRILAQVDGSIVRLMSRNGKDWTGRFPAIARALEGLGLAGTVLDGEIAVELEDGRTSFQALQNAMDARSGAAPRLRFWLFDVLFLDSEDVRSQPLLSRKALLEQVLEGVSGPLRYSDHVVGQGEAFLVRACSHGLEGIISKRADSPYRGGRFPDWLKTKCLREQEFVIGGFTEPGGSREGLGALHVGTYEEGGFVYRGKVGTGFSDAVLRDLRRRLDPLQRSDSPFVGGPRGGPARGSRWVEPCLVAEVRFTEVTNDGRLRHPVYAGLREDKDATEVRLEGHEVVHEEERAKMLPDRDIATGGDAGGKVVGRHGSVEVAGVRLTNPGRVLYPAQGVTKRGLAAYYETMAEWMLPHISERPLTLVRCPAGQQAHCFFQKHFEGSAPAGIRRIRIEERSGQNWYGVLNTTAGLVSLVQLGALEVHSWNSRADRLDRPDRLIIDLDPGPGVEWDAVVDGALHVREVLDGLGLRSFLKTTGGKGLHVAVPLMRRSDWSEVRRFAEAVATVLAQAAPELYTTEFAKQKRRGRILLDYLRNARGATAIEAYSTRASPGASVAAPVYWDELADGVRADSFKVLNMPDRKQELGEDPWKEFGAVKQSLTAPMKRQLGM
jgi:bifunctional non-homologous end joining protein LigD